MLKRMIALIFCLLTALPACAEEAAAPADPVNTPGRESCGKENCFWETPMDFRDEETMWAMLTAPMTVVDGNFRAQADVHAEPDETSPVVADVTRSSQGVHVLETLDSGWTKIELYSSSFAGSPNKFYNKLVTGYIQTELLRVEEVRTEFALVVDKLTQRLYIYQDGKLFDELLVSTGLGTAQEPENETRSGEYLLYSPTGGFWSGDLLCNYGIRYNDGDLIHEVPHVPQEEGSGYYGRTEPKLGQRASHGCIRVQRKRTEKGVNMRWIWNNMKDKMKTRLVIWEDWQGRQISVPAADTVLYYNTKSAKEYHDSPDCYGVNKYANMVAFTYGELENEEFAKLKVCTYCNPPLREQDIQAVNEKYVLSGGETAGER